MAKVTCLQPIANEVVMIFRVKRGKQEILVANDQTRIFFSLLYNKPCKCSLEAIILFFLIT